MYGTTAVLLQGIADAWWQGEALSDLADVLQAADRDDAATAVLSEALDRYERKQMIPLGRRIRERLAALQNAQA